MFSILLLNSLSPKSGDLTLSWITQDPSPGHSTFLTLAQALDFADILPCFFPSTDLNGIRPVLILLMVLFKFLWTLFE